MLSLVSRAEDKAAPRIAVLPAGLADQIAAGEVVERPGSIVKELIENSIDAGATRVEVELEAGGRERIRVIDDGRGIHRSDLELALTRHATSKLRTPEELVEIHTLGFRGEALASIAAVGRVELRSRREGETVGHRLNSIPGEAARVEPIGMPVGTQVEVAHLFANVPARRKFLRSEATEVGHCVDALVKVALVHPRVQFKLRHNNRVLLDLPACDQTSRVAQLLQRRGGSGPYLHFRGERGGVEVEAWFAPPGSATRQRSASFVVVRRRVVRERTLAAVLKQAYGDQLQKGTHPVACLFVEPPRGTVDVNVHPQKSEVRFSAAQQVFAAVREVVEEGLSTAPWRRELDPDEAGQGRVGDHGWARAPGEGEGEGGARAALAGWSRRANLGLSAEDREPARDRSGAGAGAGGGGSRYRLGTRALGRDYAEHKQGVRGQVDRLRSSLDSARGAPQRPPIFGPGEGRLPLPIEHDRLPPEADPDLHPEPAGEAEPAREGPRFLTCLPGPLALFEAEGELLSVDLRELRAHLLRRRLLTELAETKAGQRAPAQGLLEPVVLRRRLDERELLLERRDELAMLGLELDGFGEDAIIVRAVPAVLDKLIAAPEITRLVERLLPWLKLRQHAAPRGEGEAEREAGAGPDTAGFVEAVAAVARSRSVDTNPRLARRWLADALREHDGEVEAVPGLRVWTVDELRGRDPGEDRQ